MNQPCYEFIQGSYRLIEPELGVECIDHWSYLELPEDLSGCIDGSLVSIQYFETGKVHKIYSALRGVRDGQAKYFSSSGSVIWEGFYKQGRLHGPSTYFGDRGQLLSKTWFFEGKKQAQALFYSSSGTLIQSISYKEGQLHGTQRCFYDSGKKKSQMQYNQGVLEGDVLLLFESGSIKRSCFFKQGVKDGYDRIFNPEGMLLDEGCYENGIPVGLHRRFYPSGAMQEELFYENGAVIKLKKWDCSGHLLKGQGYATL